MAVAGILTHTMQQLVEATWRYSNGHGRTTAIGMKTHAEQHMMEATWRCCSGHVTMAAQNHLLILILILILIIDKPLIMFSLEALNASTVVGPLLRLCCTQ